MPPDGLINMHVPDIRRDSRACMQRGGQIAGARRLPRCPCELFVKLGGRKITSHHSAFVLFLLFLTKNRLNARAFLFCRLKWEIFLDNYWLIFIFFFLKYNFREDVDRPHPGVRQPEAVAEHGASGQPCRSPSWNCDPEWSTRAARDWGVPGGPQLLPAPCSNLWFPVLSLGQGCLWWLFHFQRGEGEGSSSTQYILSRNLKVQAQQGSGMSWAEFPAFRVVDNSCPKLWRYNPNALLVHAEGTYASCFLFGICRWDWCISPCALWE